MSNSNFNITKVTVDPVSQEISSLEINGKPIETGGGSELETVIFDARTPLNVSSVFGPKLGPVEIHPSEGYDGIEKVTIQPDGLTGYPLFDPTKLGFAYEAEQPEGLELLETIEIQNAPGDYTYYIVVKYDEEGVGYIIVDQIAGEEP